MPLQPGSSKKTIYKNIKELIEANKEKPEDEKRPMKQIEAIAYSKAGKSRKKK